MIINSRYGITTTRRRGFTFLEIILVVAIIGILVSIVGPRLVGKSKKARIQATKASMTGIGTALQVYEINHGDFPSTTDGLEALVTRPSSADEDDWEKLLAKLPKDTWGNPFRYAYPSDHGMDYDISSDGPDQTEGSDDDITNWEDVDSGQL